MDNAPADAAKGTEVRREIRPLDNSADSPQRSQPIFAHLKERPVSPGLKPSTIRAEPFRARALSRRGQLLLDFCLPRPCRRPIAFAETLAASAIPPLDET